jgi:HK97 gp10 family phage protein
MAATKGVTIEGLEELHDVLLEVAPREARTILQKTVDGIAAHIADRLRARAPVRKGKLRAAIYSARAKAKSGKPAADVRIKADGFYWHFVEFGTVHARARPFIVPTVESERVRAAEKFKEDFGPQYAKALERKARKK